MYFTTCVAANTKVLSYQNDTGELQISQGIPNTCEIRGRENGSPNISLMAESAPKLLHSSEVCQTLRWPRFTKSQKLFAVECCSKPGVWQIIFIKLKRILWNFERTDVELKKHEERFMMLCTC